MPRLGWEWLGVKKLRVISIGLGPIGMAAARLAAQKNSMELVGALDLDPKKVGRDLGELLGGTASGVLVESEASAALERLKPDIAIHCTSSFIPRVAEQLELVASKGVNVVSSSEELLVPDHRHSELAGKIEAAALRGGATVVGTGVNPGYAMDFLAVVASAVCYRVDGVKCLRVVDAGTRRLPLQRKVGAGLTVEEFEAKKAAGGFGHIGMEESVVLVSRGLGLEVDNVEQTLEPVVAKERFETKFLTVEPGQVAGIRNIGRGRFGGQVRIELDLTMAVGSPHPRDEVELESEPKVKLSFPTGIPGDQATAAILVNTAHQVVQARPGLLTVLDLPAPRIAL